jgi:hypothetical protein
MYHISTVLISVVKLHWMKTARSVLLKLLLGKNEVKGEVDGLKSLHDEIERITKFSKEGRPRYLAVSSGEQLYAEWMVDKFCGRGGSHVYD